MQQWIELNTKIANDSIATLKQFGELNLKTAEALLEEQKSTYEKTSEVAKSTFEKFSAAKDVQTVLDLQNEVMQDALTSTLANWKKTIAIATDSHESARSLVEASLETAKGNFEQTVATVEETTEAAKEAVKQAA